MAWADEMIPILRIYVSDINSVKYTDANLKSVLVVAARRVDLELKFDNNYTINIVVPDISPDPTDPASLDENFINLTTAQAACIMDRGSASRAAGQAILVRDGSSEIDLRDTFKAWRSIMQEGWCAVYDKMKSDYVYAQINGGRGVGRVVSSPIRYFSRYSGMLFDSGRRL